MNAHRKNVYLTKAKFDAYHTELAALGRKLIAENIQGEYYQARRDLFLGISAMAQSAADGYIPDIFKHSKQQSVASQRKELP